MEMGSNIWKIVFGIFIFLFGGISSLILFDLIDITLDSYLSFFASIIGIIGAYGVANYQINKEKRPLIILGNKKYQNLPMIGGKNLNNPSESIKKSDKFSDLTVPIINGGNSAVFNISIEYEFDNLEEIIKDYKKANTDEYYLKYDNNQLLRHISNDERSSSIRYDGNKKYFTDEIPVIMPGESHNVQIPTLFLELLQYFCNNRLIVFDDEYKVAWLPKVKTTMCYDDYKMNRKEKIYYITISSFSIDEDRGNKMIKFSGNLKPFLTK